MAKVGDFLKAQAGQFVDAGVNKLLGLAGLGGPSGPSDGFKINEFAANLDKSGVAKLNQFEVFVLGGKSVGQERELRYRAEAVDIPGRNFTLTEHKFTNIGPFNRIPTQQTYTDVTVSFLLSEDLREKDYFEAWQESIMNTGAYEGNQASAANEKARTEAEENLIDGVTGAGYSESYVASPFNYKYFDEYVGRVEIRTYGAAGDLRSIHTLNEAYPISIAPVSLSWGEEGVARLQVTFAYKNYKVVFNKADQPGMGFGFSFSLGKGGLKLGANLPGIGSIGYAKGAGIGGNLGGLTKKIFG